MTEQKQTTEFQLIFNGDLEDRAKFILIADDVADILEIPLEFVGVHFTGHQAILHQSADFSKARNMQVALEKLGIYCDLKPVVDEQEDPMETVDNAEFADAPVLPALSPEVEYKNPNVGTVNPAVIDINALDRLSLAEDDEFLHTPKRNIVKPPKTELDVDLERLRSGGKIEPEF